MIKIGFWRQYKEEKSNLPFPEEGQITEERLKITGYLDSGEIVNSYKGWSNCRLCGKMNGSTEKSDGKYLWPSGLSHYIRDHGVILDKKFEKNYFKDQKKL